MNLANSCEIQLFVRFYFFILILTADVIVRL